MSSTQFTPKSGAEMWFARISQPEHSGYDLVLFLDKVKATPDSGWMLELAVDADGKVSGQITAHPGYDALAIFDCTQDTLRISDNCGGPDCIITDASPAVGADHPKGLDSQAEVACRLLVQAYANGEERDGSIDWSDVDEACEVAKEALARP